MSLFEFLNCFEFKLGISSLSLNIIRWNFDYKLKKVSDDKLPEYLQSSEIRSKLKQWFD